MLLLLLGLGCAGSSPASPPTSTPTPPPAPAADALAVLVNGAPGAYSFAVTVKSPDLNCTQYADWWEVVDEQGALLYRRILAHSHPTEQPFTRDGGPVPIPADQTVWVRAHMNPGGYGGTTLHGSVATGFQPASWPKDLGAGLATAAPQPERCAF